MYVYMLIKYYTFTNEQFFYAPYIVNRYYVFMLLLYLSYITLAFSNILPLPLGKYRTVTV